jgi:hypothetical protein
MTYDHISLILQVGLLGEVFPALRGVGFTLENERVELVFYHDGALSEEDRESAACIETEVLAGLPKSVVVVSQVIRVDTPKSMPDPGRWVYRRRE